MTRAIDKYKRLWGYLRPYWHLELLTFVIMIVIAGLALALPGAVQYLIDNLIPSLISGEPSAKLSKVVYFGLFLVAIYVANVLFSLLRDYLGARIGSNIIVDMRMELFRHYERLPLRFHQGHQVGEIMSRFLSDVGRVQDLMTATLLTFLTNLLLLVAILAYLLRINWYMTLIALTPVPLTILLSNLFGRKLNRIMRRLQERFATLSARVQETLLSIKVVKAFGQEEREGRKVSLNLRDLAGLYVQSSVASSLAGNLVHLVNMLGPIVILTWGTYLIAGGGMKLGALMAFYMLLTLLYSPVRDLAAMNIQVQSAMASVDRVFEYLDEPVLVIEPDKPVALARVRGEIEFKSVSFSHGTGDFQLRDLSLHIPAGERLAVVGPSGSGKTTLINLVLRFFDPNSGAVLLDGVDVRQLSRQTLRGNIGLVDQDPLLFHATIFENIAYGFPEADAAHVQQAAQAANIHEFVSGLSDGYRTMVGERGVTLSGGEKQRLCLARAILRNPPVLILDEATSALDSNSEQMIQESLKRILVGKTAIIIAHRLSTVQHADRIVLVDRGQIIGEGKHQDLLQSSPLYRDLAEKQLLV